MPIPNTTASAAFLLPLIMSSDDANYVASSPLDNANEDDSFGSYSETLAAVKAMKKAAA